MKKIMVVVAAILLSTGVAFAGSSSLTNPYAGGHSADGAGDFHGNDGAWAIGGSGGTAENYGTSSFNGWGGTAAVGTAKAIGTTGAVAGVKDFGKTSVSGAAVGTVVNTTAAGVSGYAGFGSGKAYNESTGIVGGKVEQGNFANEVGYQGGDKAQAGNTSGAGFIGITKDSDYTSGKYIGAAVSGISMTGAAGTAGGSIASVDPNKSSFAATGSVSAAKVVGADCADSAAWGQGGIQTFVNTGNPSNGANAGGNGSYGYNGSEFGAGGSVMKSEVNQSGSSFSSKSTGASFAISK